MGGEKPLRSALVLAGILLIAANLRAALTAVGPVLEVIRQDLGLGADAAALLISLPLLAFALVSPLAPWVSRRLGLEWSLAGSLVLLSLATAWRSMPWPGALWMGTIGLGVAIAMLNVLLPVLVKQWYPRHIGPVTGVYTAVQSGVGGLAAGVAVPIAALSGTGWRLALGVWAALALMALAVYWPQLRRARVAARNSAAAAPVAADGENPDREAEPLLRSVWRLPLAWQVALFMGLQSTVYYTIITWWPAIETHNGVSAAVAGGHQVVLQLVAVLSSLVAAALLYRLRQQSTLLAAVTVLALVAVVGQLLAPGLALLWIVCLGFFGGVAIVVALSLFGLRTRNYQQAAALSGMAQSVGYLLAAVLGPFLAGVVRETFDSWQAPLYLLIVILVGVLVSGVLAGRARYVD